MKKMKILLIISLFPLSFSKGEEKELAIALSPGYSFGIASRYRASEQYWRHPPLSPDDRYYERDELGFNFRLAMIYHLSKRFVLEGEIEYQRLVYHRWGGSAVGYIDVKRDKSFWIPHLNLIYLFKKRGKITPYLGGGIGFSHIVFYIPFPALKVGGGLKYAISPNINADFRSFLNYNVRTFRHLSLNVGLEFKP